MVLDSKLILKGNGQGAIHHLPDKTFRFLFAFTRPFRKQELIRIRFSQSLHGLVDTVPVIHNALGAIADLA